MDYINLMKYYINIGRPKLDLTKDVTTNIFAGFGGSKGGGVSSPNKDGGDIESLAGNGGGVSSSASVFN